MNTAELIKNAAVNNPVYSIFGKEAILNLLESLNIDKTTWKEGIKSERSLCLVTADTKAPEDLISAFGLNPRTFPKKFRRAISGDGHEHQRIRTLHSSSLISLLCFYDVSEIRPLCITVEGHDIEFTDSRFEVKNPIGNDEDGKPHESNMDVVLVGRDKKSGRKAILFLESKFSEYLAWGKHSKISNRVYLKTYTQLFDKGYLDRMGLRYNSIDETEYYSELASKKGRTQHYAGGIKQMVSHFLGVKNAVSTGLYEDYDIYLGEILYRFPELVDPKGNKFYDYTRLYGILAEGLNAISESKFKIIGHCLTYQDVFQSYDLDNAVREFYSL